MGFFPMRGGGAQTTAGNEATANSTLVNVTNGTFTGNATGWTLTDGWSYDSNDLKSAAGNNGTITQTVTGLVSGRSYDVLFGILSTVGSVACALGGGTPGSSVSGNTTVTQQIVAGGATSDIVFTATNHTSSSFDNVKIADTPQGVLMTNGGVANTKSGTWDQLIASTLFNSNSVAFTICNGTVATTDFMLDIAIGGAGSEVIIIPNLHMTTNAVTTSSICEYRFPFTIPKGSRLSAQMQSQDTTATCRVSVRLFPGSLHDIGCNKVIGMGADTSLSTSTLITRPAVNSVMGAWLALNTSTSHAVRYLIVHFGFQQPVATQRRLMDIGIGGAGSEVIIIEKIPFTQNTTSDEIVPWTAGPFQVDIPAGSRVSARYQQDVTSAGRDVYAQLYGLC